MKFLLLLLLCVSQSRAALTTISDVLYDSQQRRANCILYATPSQSWISAQGKVIRPDPIFIQVINGVLSTSLEDNTTSIPTGTSYNVVYQCGTTFTKTWIIPTGGPVGISAIETNNLIGTTSLIALSQLQGLPIVFTNVANTYSGGLLQDLSAMKIKLPTSTVAGLPAASSSSGLIYVVGDGISSADCTVGLSSTQALCISNGTIWTPLGGAGGGGTVTNVGTGAGLAGGPITGIGTIKLSEAPNNQTGATYTYLNSDCGKIVTHANAGAIAATLPTSNSGGQFLTGCPIEVQNYGPATLTITPVSGTIGGSGSLALTTGQGAKIVSNAGNYDIQLGKGGSGGASWASQLLDWSLTRTSATRLTACAGASSTTPCRAKVGNLPYFFTAPITVDLGATAAGLAFFYVDTTGAVIVGVPSGYTPLPTCSGCTAVQPITNYTPDVFQGGTWNATANNWDANITQASAVAFGSRGKFLGAGGCVVTQTADSVTYNCPGGGSSLSPVDLTQAWWIIDLSSQTSSIPNGMYMPSSGGGCPINNVAPTPTGQTFTLNFSPPDALANSYCYLVKGTLAGPSSAFPDFNSAANWQPFTARSVISFAGFTGSYEHVRFGVFNAVNAGISDGVYLDYTQNVSANWKCVVRNGGASTIVDTGVAATNAVQSVEVSSSVTGVLTCRVGPTSGTWTTVTNTAAFPAASWFGLEVINAIAAQANITWSSPVIQVTNFAR